MSSKDHFSEDEDNRSEGSFYEPSVGMEALDEDHRLLIRGVQPLLRSRNPAVSGFFPIYLLFFRSFFSFLLRD